MVLVIDFRQDESRLLLADQQDVRSYSGGRGAGFQQLGQALDALVDGKRPEGVAVVLPDKSAPTEARMSWSTVRAAVSMANSLAFAWGVPAVQLPDGEGGELIAAAQAALQDSDATARVSALYDGEPNITKPKS